MKEWQKRLFGDSIKLWLLCEFRRKRRKKQRRTHSNTERSRKWDENSKEYTNLWLSFECKAKEQWETGKWNYGKEKISLKLYLKWISCLKQEQGIVYSEWKFRMPVIPSFDICIMYTYNICLNVYCLSSVQT